MSGWFYGKRLTVLVDEGFSPPAKVMGIRGNIPAGINPIGANISPAIEE